MYELLFDTTVNLCDKFHSLDPISIRCERASEVFKLIKRLSDHNRRESKRGTKKSNVIRKPAGDNWF